MKNFILHASLGLALICSSGERSWAQKGKVVIENPEQGATPTPTSTPTPVVSSKGKGKVVIEDGNPNKGGQNQDDVVIQNPKGGPRLSGSGDPKNTVDPTIMQQKNKDPVGTTADKTIDKTIDKTPGTKVDDQNKQPAGTTVDDKNKQPAGNTAEDKNKKPGADPNTKQPVDGDQDKNQDKNKTTGPNASNTQGVKKTGSSADQTKPGDKVEPVQKNKEEKKKKKKKGVKGVEQNNQQQKQPGQKVTPNTPVDDQRTKKDETTFTPDGDQTSVVDPVTQKKQPTPSEEKTDDVKNNSVKNDGVKNDAVKNEESEEDLPTQMGMGAKEKAESESNVQITAVTEASKTPCQDEALRQIYELLLKDDQNILAHLFELTSLRLAKRAAEEQATTVEDKVKNDIAELETRLETLKGSVESQQEIQKIYQAYGLASDVKVIQSDLEATLKKGKDACYWCRSQRLQNTHASAYILAISVGEKNSGLSEVDAATVWVVEKLRAEAAQRDARYRYGKDYGNLLNVSVRAARYLGRIHGGLALSPEEIQAEIDRRMKAVEESIQVASQAVMKSIEDCIRAKNTNCAQCVKDELEAFKSDVQKVEEIQKGLLKMIAKSDQAKLVKGLKGKMGEVTFDFSDYAQGTGIARDTRRGKYDACGHLLKKKAVSPTPSGSRSSQEVGGGRMPAFSAPNYVIEKQVLDYTQPETKTKEKPKAQLSATPNSADVKIGLGNQEKTGVHHPFHSTVNLLKTWIEKNPNGEQLSPQDLKREFDYVLSGHSVFNPGAHASFDREFYLRARAQFLPWMAKNPGKIPPPYLEKDAKTLQTAFEEFEGLNESWDPSLIPATPQAHSAFQYRDFLRWKQKVELWKKNHPGKNPPAVDPLQWVDQKFLNSYIQADMACRGADCMGGNRLLYPFASRQDCLSACVSQTR